MREILSIHWPDPPAWREKTRGDRRSAGVSDAAAPAAGPLQRGSGRHLPNSRSKCTEKRRFRVYLQPQAPARKRRRGGRDIGGGSNLVNRRRRAESEEKIGVSPRPAAIAKAQCLRECPPQFHATPDAFPEKEHPMTSLSCVSRYSTAAHARLRRYWRLSLAAALLLPLVLAAPVRAAEDDPVVARVNGVEIRTSDLAMAEEDIGSNLPMTGENRREYLTKYVADMIIVAQAAESKKMQDREDFKRRLAYSRNKLLMEAMLQQEGKASISETALHQLYDEATKQMAGEKEVHARHILVDTEDEAKTVLAQLKKGGDFAALAKEKSKDPGAANGGDLGYFTKDQMVPEFANAAFKLEAGQLSDPVKTQFGWHVIKVEEKRDRQIPEFDKVRDQLENFVARRSQADLVNKLRAQANVEKVETAPEPALPAPGMPKQK
jgi:peptidyl-prolyl cis-trans isomerase C